MTLWKKLQSLKLSPMLNAFFKVAFEFNVSFSCYRPTLIEVTFVKPALSHDWLSMSHQQDEKRVTIKIQFKAIITIK